MLFSGGLFFDVSKPHDVSEPHAASIGYDDPAVMLDDLESRYPA